MKRRRRLALAACAAAFATVLTGASTAAALTQTQQAGTADLGCTSETAACAADAAFTPSFGGYRAGGQVDWTMTVDRAAFGSIASIELTVLVVGMRYTGNIDAATGPRGNYLAVDGAPFAAFSAMTDGRDARTFALPTTLTSGAHTFAVVAYGAAAGALYEGWAGVDVATLTIGGQASAVPEPNVAALLGCGVCVLTSAAVKPRAGAVPRPSKQELA